MDHTELGRAGELALDLYAMVSSDGELELFSPVADDDHVDATAGRRGGVPAIAIQVKTVREVDRNGLLAVIDSLGHHIPPQLVHGSEGLMMARRRPLQVAR